MTQTPQMPVTTDAPAEERRTGLRRRDDLITLGLVTTVCAIGIAWGTATAAVGQKVDRGEFTEHVGAEERRHLADSLKSMSMESALRRIESKQDSTNIRLSRLICDKKPTYCQ